jgi:hypothetical protein
VSGLGFRELHEKEGLVGRVSELDKRDDEGWEVV